MVWQDGKGSRFHPDSLLPAVHDWIRVLPKKRRGPILLTRSPRGGAVARPASLLNQRPFKSLFLLKVVLVFSGQAGVITNGTGAGTRGSWSVPCFQRLNSSTASLRATATMARFFSRTLVPARCWPYARNAQAGPNGPRM